MVKKVPASSDQALTAAQEAQQRSIRLLVTLSIWGETCPSGADLCTTCTRVEDGLKYC